MIEPANQIAPITADSTLVNDTSYVIATLPELTYLSSSPAATSAAAPPPAPLKIATICGIAVIFTRCAETMPTTAPTSSAAPIDDPVHDALASASRRPRSACRRR